jgi:hypothetical protein
MSTAATHRQPPSSSSGCPNSRALSVSGLAVQMTTVAKHANREAPCARMRLASTSASAPAAARHGTATVRNTAIAPPPHSPGKSANGARSTSEPPYAGAKRRNSSTCPRTSASNAGFTSSS